LLKENANLQSQLENSKKDVQIIQTTLEITKKNSKRFTDDALSEASPEREIFKIETEKLKIEQEILKTEYYRLESTCADAKSKALRYKADIDVLKEQIN
jgi:hypothetical protein